MSNLENKEEKVVNKIVSVVNKLDKELDELDTLSENPEKKHNLKKWLVERKAIHEIKKVYRSIFNKRPRWYGIRSFLYTYYRTDY